MPRNAAKIHPTLCEANKLLLIFNNLKVNSNESVQLWSLIEKASPTFAGVGTLDTTKTLNQENAKLWDKRPGECHALNSQISLRRTS